MPIKIEHPEDGKEIEVYTTEELEAMKQEAVKPFQEIETKYNEVSTEFENLKKIHAQQASNFKRLRDMTEEEKSKLTAEQIEARKIAEKALEENESLKASIEAERKASMETKRESLIKFYAGDNKELREKLEGQLSIVSETLSVEDRIKAAATLAGIAVNKVNPLYQSFSGEAPAPKTPKDDKEAFLASDKAKAAIEYMDKL